MLLWLPTNADPPLLSPPRKKRSTPQPPVGMDTGDGEKADKLRRRRRNLALNRFRNAVISVMGLVGAGLIYLALSPSSFHHHVKPSVLRTPHEEGETTPDHRNEREMVNVHRKEEEEKEIILPENSIYRLKMKDINGKMIALERFAGMVTLVVNTACKWGKTRVEYEELSILNEDLEDEGFQVLAFPSNDFHQELPSNEKILKFWNNQFPEATFPIFEQSSLHTNPVYQRLQEHLPNEHVQHNFFKYLVNRQGIAVRMFHKRQDPLTLMKTIKEFMHATEDNKESDAR